MGVCISQKLGQYKHCVKDTLDRAEEYANTLKNNNVVDDVEIEVERLSDFHLLIDITGCETLSFNFKSVKEINKQGKNGWNYMYAVLTDDGKEELDEGYMIKEYPHNEKYYSADFTKTQYAGNIMAHKVVADLVKIVASRCFYAEVHDEGDYYHTSKLGDAVKSIRENGAMIDSLGEQLAGLGWKKENIIKGGETIIGKV